MKSLSTRQWVEITRKELDRVVSGRQLPSGRPHETAVDRTSHEKAWGWANSWAFVYMGLCCEILPVPKSEEKRFMHSVMTGRLAESLKKSLKSARARPVDQFDVPAAVYSGVHDAIEQCVNSFNRDRMAMARALRAGVDLVASLREVNPLYGNYLLELMRTWNGLGRVEHLALDEAREVALLRYVGVDEGYLTKYEELRSWALNHSKDTGGGWQFYKAAMPLMETFVSDRRIDEAARVCRDIFEVACKKVEDKKDAQKEGASRLGERAAAKALKQLLNLMDTALAAGHIDFASALQVPAILCGEAAPDDAKKQESLILEYLRVAAVLTYVERSDLKAVVKLIEEAIEPQPLPVRMQNDFGWRVFQLLKANAAAVRKTESKKQAYTIRAAGLILCKLYRQLDGVEKPSLLHSSVLRHACALLRGEELVEFLQAWDLSLLREEDFEPWYPEEGKRVDSLVEVLIPAVYRSLKAMLPILARYKKRGEASPDMAVKHSELREACIQLVSFVGEHYQRYAERDIYHYYHAQMLCWTQRRDEARTELLSKAGAFSHRWWFWSALASTYDEEPLQEFRLLCRAYLTCPESEMSYLTRVERKVKHLASTLGVEWNDESLLEYGQQADLCLQDQETTTDGVVLSVTTEGDVFRLKALIPSDEQTIVIEGSVARREAADWVRGQPVQLVLGYSIKGSVILSAVERDGERWDILPWLDAVVIGVRAARGVWVVRLENGDEIHVNARHWHQAREWQVGQPIRLKLLKEGIQRLVVAETVGDGFPGFARQVEGAVTEVDAHGNAEVEPDVRIPRRLAVPLGLRPGAKVAATVVKDRRSKERWEAIHVTPTH